MQGENRVPSSFNMVSHRFSIFHFNFLKFTFFTQHTLSDRCFTDIILENRKNHEIFQNDLRYPVLCIQQMPKYPRLFDILDIQRIKNLL